MAQINCRVCGKTIIVPESRKDILKCCSKECRKVYEQGLTTIVNCEHCQKLFDVYVHELPRKRYCSRECSDRGKQRKVEVQCETCGKLFYKPKSKIQGEHVYCSRGCAHKGMQKRKTMKCVICGAPVTRAQSQFKGNAVCSAECNSQYARKRATGGNSPVYNSLNKSCIVCGHEFVEPVSRVRQGKGKFCSRQCKYAYYKEHFQEYNNPNWRGGGKGYRGPNWNEQRKRALIRDNFTCQKCGAETNLVVHHKEPWQYHESDYRIANRMENLVVLCVPCHISLHKSNP